MLVSDARGILYLLLSAARLDEDGKITNLVRHLMQQNGDRGDRANGRPHQEGSADGKTVRKVVCKISSKIQIGRHFDIYG